MSPAVEAPCPNHWTTRLVPSKSLLWKLQGIKMWRPSFAQWQYRSQWGLSEARLLLIEKCEDLNGVIILDENRWRWSVILQMYRKPVHPSSQFHDHMMTSIRFWSENLLCRLWINYATTHWYLHIITENIWSAKHIDHTTLIKHYKLYYIILYSRANKPVSHFP